jgi:hypothetical protein
LGNHETLAASVQNAKEVILYEGLPHQISEKKLLDAEVRSKKTVRYHDFLFYQERLQLKEEDAKQLTTLFCSSASFRQHEGGKKCGGFHPDFCIEWRAGGEVFQALICLGCHEMKAFGPSAELYCDISRSAYDNFKGILRPYRQNRPGEVEW